MTEKFTPGPWKYCEGGDGICKCGCIMDDEGHIAEVFGPFHLGDGIDGPNPVPDREHQRANMRLIATAPAMIGAMDEVYIWLLNIVTEGNLDDRDNATCPLCFLPEPGNFDSIHEGDHHDGCPWPLFLKARSLAREV